MRGGEARLREAVLRVDDAMCKIRDAGKVRARDRIAVLAALNLAFDLADKAEPAADASIAPIPSRDGAAATESQALRTLLEHLDDALSEDGQLL